MSLKTHSPARTYTIGFVWALVLTNAAFITVQLGLANGWLLVLLLTILAVGQLWIQLHFFLHLGRESKPRWNLMMFLFAVLVVGILVFGSLWIMNNLGYHNMPATSSDAEIMQDEGIFMNSEREEAENE